MITTILIKRAETTSDGFYRWVYEYNGEESGIGFGSGRNFRGVLRELGFGVGFNEDGSPNVNFMLALMAIDWNARSADFLNTSSRIGKIGEFNDESPNFWRVRE